MSRSGGIGIAAPQIGVSSRIVIVSSLLRGKRVLVNPTISSAFGFSLSHEGCLSLPGTQRLRPRYRWLRYSYDTLEGEHKEGCWAGQLFSYCVQHEVDHLNGILITDRMPRAERVARAAVTPTEEEILAYAS
jgi:peptide deformylase